jgi:imidazolonepropionase-like amidohydrolase
LSLGDGGGRGRANGPGRSAARERSRHTFAWDDPSTDFTPAANVPRSAARFRPDAEAVAIRGNRIVLMGGARDALAHRGPKTGVMDVDGATVLPGLVDSHAHIAEVPKAEGAA